MLPSPVKGGDPRRAAAFCPFGHRRPSPPPPRTMEEVWRDINLHEISVPNQNAPSSAAASSRTFILPDFLKRPAAADSAAPPAPANDLNLNSGPDFYFPAENHRDDDDSPSGHHVNGGDDRCHLGPFGALGSSVLTSFGKNRLPEGGNGDRRHKRMMKNRESAARSRARKQAYINGLLLKIAHLTEENNKLKEEEKKLMTLQAEPVHQRPEEPLQRTSTAPF